MKTINIPIGKLFDAIQEYENIQLHYQLAYKLTKSNIQIKNENDKFCDIPAIIKKQDSIIILTFSDHTTLYVGANHYFIQNKQWPESSKILAKDIIIGTKLQKADGTFISVIEKIHRIGAFDVFDLQINSQNHLYQTPNGLIHHNSLIMALLCRAYNKDNILIIVNRLDLIEQTYTKLLEYGFNEKDLGIIQGNNTTQSRRITILSQQSYEKAFNVLPRIKIIICDEVHETGRTDTAEKVIYAAQNASIKIGLSATPFTDNDFQTMRLYGNIGPIIYQKEIQEQIENDYLAQTKIQIYSYECEPIFITGHWADKYDVQRITSKKHKANLIKAQYDIIVDGNHEYGRKLVEHGDEYNHIINNESRNRKIIEIIKAYVKEKKRSLVIFNIIQHGEILKELYSKGILIHGEHELEERKAAEMTMREIPGTVIFSSKIWQQGKDIDVLDVVINVGGGHATSKVIQKLGRVTRKSKSTHKPIAIAIDFDDSKLSKIGNSQFRKRLVTYKKLGIPIEYI